MRRRFLSRSFVPLETCSFWIACANEERKYIYVRVRICGRVSTGSIVSEAELSPIDLSGMVE